MMGSPNLQIVDHQEAFWVSAIMTLGFIVPSVEAAYLEAFRRTQDM
jgi:hypothetical protein